MRILDFGVLRRLGPEIGGIRMRLRGPITLTVLMLAPFAAALAMSEAGQELAEVLQARPDLDRGAQYFTVCAGCHGVNGGGKINAEGKLNGVVPRIGGQHFSVLARQLVAYRHGQRWDIMMENFADSHRLPDAQAIADVVAYVSSLDDPSPAGVGTGEWVEHGAKIYARLCESCHGTSGEGDAAHQVPRIAGQHYEYLRRQVYDAVDGRRPGFPPSHVRLFAKLEHNDIAGVADYLSRIAPQRAEPETLPAATH
jgi:cytochrome c553